MQLMLHLVQSNLLQVLVARHIPYLFSHRLQLVNSNACLFQFPFLCPWSCSGPHYTAPERSMPCLLPPRNGLFRRFHERGLMSGERVESPFHDASMIPFPLIQADSGSWAGTVVPFIPVLIFKFIMGPNLSKWSRIGASSFTWHQHQHIEGS